MAFLIGSLISSWMENKKSRIKKGKDNDNKNQGIF